jgi:hypothetical protein
MAALMLPIPAGHCLHWRVRPDGVMEVELMLVLTPSNARWNAIETRRAGEARFRKAFTSNG